MDLSSDPDQLAMTVSEGQRFVYYRTIVALGHSGLTDADALVSLAAKWLDAVLDTPCKSPPLASDSSSQTPVMTRPRLASSSGSRHASSSSARSQHCYPRALCSSGSISSSGISQSQLRSTSSSASLSTDTYSATGVSLSSPDIMQTSALNSLRRVQANSGHARDEQSPAIRDRSMRRKDSLGTTNSARLSTPAPNGNSRSSSCSVNRVSLLLPDQSLSPSLHSILSPSTPTTPTTIRPSSSSPNLPLVKAKHPTLSPLRAQQFSSSLLLPTSHHIATLDPALASAELSSALTKHVSCNVCQVSGINFPECRKCGMRFCGRSCRVGQRGAGDGNRSVTISTLLCPCEGYVWEPRDGELD